MTRGYNLPAKYIIHTVGPQIRRLPVSKMNQDLLAKCYLSCLKLADQHSLNHVAFAVYLQVYLLFLKMKQQKLLFEQ